MLIISRTPLRISFFGGGTDYPMYYDSHRGAVLGTTINQYTYISLKTMQGAFFNHNFRIAYSKTELVKEVDEIEHPSIRECLKHRKLREGLDIHIFSDLPARTGLGSSSSFTVGFLNALDALHGKKRSKQQLADEACFVEQQCIRENVGSQDQFHASFGGFNILEFSSSQIHVRPVVVKKEKKKLLEENLLVFFTGVTRHASEIVKEQIDKTKSRKNDVHLEEMYSLVAEAENILLSSPSHQVVEKFGRLLHENWRLKKSLSTQISNPKIDAAYAAALQAGAFGGKLCGAGNGGFLMFFVPEEKQVAVRSALKDLPEVSFQFEDQGSTIIYIKD